MGTRRAGAMVAAADARLPVKKRKGGGRRGRRVPNAATEDECPRLLRQTRVGRSWCRRASTAAGGVRRLLLGHSRGEYTTRAHPRRQLGESAQRVELTRPCRGTPAAPAAGRGHRRLARQPSCCPPHPRPAFAAPAAAGPSANADSSRSRRGPRSPSPVGAAARGSCTLHRVKTASSVLRSRRRWRPTAATSARRPSHAAGAAGRGAARVHTAVRPPPL